jgi:uncharacterized protein YqgV (UPF0045/DUF77 family)
MKLAVEISLYPLNESYIGYIKDFIERLNTDDELFVSTSHTSTIVSGEYDYVMAVMQKEMKATFTQLGQAIFVCKFLNATQMDLS